MNKINVVYAFLSFAAMSTFAMENAPFLETNSSTPPAGSVLASSVLAASEGIMYEDNIATMLQTCEERRIDQLLYYAHMKTPKRISDLNCVSFNMTPLLAACALGSEAVALKLIEEGSDINFVGSYGLTALHYVAANGLDEVAAFLLFKDVAKDVTDNSGNSPVDYAIRSGHFCITYLLGGKNSCYALINTDLIKPGISNEAVESLVSQGRSSGFGMLTEFYEATDTDESWFKERYLNMSRAITPVEAVLGLGDESDSERAAIALILLGASLNKSDELLPSATDYAAFYGYNNALALLLWKGAEFSKALNHAVRGRNFCATTLLLAHIENYGHNLEDFCDTDDSPLGDVTYKGRTDKNLALLLLKHNIDVMGYYDSAGTGFPAKAHAILYADPEVVAACIERGGLLTRDQIIGIGCAGDEPLEKVQTLLDNSAVFPEPDSDEEGFIENAINWDAPVPFIELLLENGANIDLIGATNQYSCPAYPGKNLAIMALLENERYDCLHLFDRYGADWTTLSEDEKEQLAELRKEYRWHQRHVALWLRSGNARSRVNSVNIMLLLPLDLSQLMIKEFL